MSGEAPVDISGIETGDDLREQLEPHRLEDTPQGQAIDAVMTELDREGGTIEEAYELFQEALRQRTLKEGTLPVDLLGQIFVEEALDSIADMEKAGGATPAAQVRARYEEAGILSGEETTREPTLTDEAAAKEADAAIRKARAEWPDPT